VSKVTAGVVLSGCFESHVCRLAPVKSCRSGTAGCLYAQRVSVMQSRHRYRWHVASSFDVQRDARLGLTSLDRCTPPPARHKMSHVLVRLHDSQVYISQKRSYHIRAVRAVTWTSDRRDSLSARSITARSSRSKSRTTHTTSHDLEPSRPETSKRS
jgi:hypothetical protein